jgi:hypothetical protein
MPDYGSTDNSALWAAAAQSVNNASSYMAASNLNRRTQKFSKEMYEKQRTDALSDWNMQNEYNSPIKQMERLKAADLNPNLVYGNGAQMSAATTVKGSDIKPWNPSLPATDLASPITSYLDTRMKNAQLDNLQAQNAVMQQDNLLKAAQTLKTAADAKGQSFTNELNADLRDVSIQAKQAALDKTLIDISSVSHGIDRAQDLHPGNLQMQIEQLAAIKINNAKSEAEKDRIRQTIENLKKSGKIQDYEIKLNKSGLDRSSPWYGKLLRYMLGSLFGNDD